MSLSFALGTFSLVHETVLSLFGGQGQTGGNKNRPVSQVGPHGGGSLDLIPYGAQVPYGKQGRPQITWSFASAAVWSLWTFGWQLFLLENVPFACQFALEPSNWSFQVIVSSCTEVGAACSTKLTSLVEGKAFEGASHTSQKNIPHFWQKQTTTDLLLISLIPFSFPVNGEHLRICMT